MKSRIIAKGILQAVGFTAALVFLCYFLYLTRSVIAYIAIAGVVSLVGRPMVLFLRQKLKFKNIFAVIVTMTLLIGVMAGLILMFVPLVIDQGKNLSLLNVKELEANFQQLYQEVVDYFSARNIDLEQRLSEYDLFSQLNFSTIPNLLNSIGSTLGNFTIGLFSVLFISFFFLKDSRLFEGGMLKLIPKGKEKQAKKSIETIKGLLSRYFIGLLFQILILFTIYTIVLLIFGIDNALVIAFLCALLNLIPYVGPLVGGFLMMLLSMTSNLGESFSEVILPTTTYVMIGFVVGQMIDNFFSQPFIFSNSVKSHPLEIFLVIITGGQLFGVIGMVLAVPTYTAIKVILKEFSIDNKIFFRNF